MKTTLRIVGPIGDPRLAFDVDGLKEEFKTALVAAGKQELASRLSEALGDKLPEGVPDVKDVVDDPLKAGKSALEGILGGQKKDKEDGK